jgi:hypothetical protein
MFSGVAVNVVARHEAGLSDETDGDGRPGRYSTSPPNRVTQIRGIPDEVDDASSSRGAIPTWTDLSR